MYELFVFIFFVLFVSVRLKIYLFQMSMKRSQWCLEGKDQHVLPHTQNGFIWVKFLFHFHLSIAYTKKKAYRPNSRQLWDKHSRIHNSNSNRFNFIQYIAFVPSRWCVLCLSGFFLSRKWMLAVAHAYAACVRA